MRQFDQFGQKVELKYKNESTYNTAFGGCVSVVVLFILALVGLSDLYDNL